ncbi:hypothetical protein [Mucilaginibacter ginsenosidivorans]|uniref:Uncharacterized protein n=1 Tax=Mucilaginibacter ginsenosidivorans TaxID=398053 RepID=A0A5B8UUD9_9SPHI|nr:hypothetical protein [Mucilaginibacter ginsenosidivorans]QEC62519.1 hypothetical protein FRZ54_07930 [Mucilaginibacter ginsenosidivorans]
MPELVIENSYPASKDIDNLYAAFLAIHKDAVDKLLKITATVEIVKLDIRYIGYLILCKQARPDIEFLLEFPLNNEPRHNGFQYILYQYGTYAYLMTKSGVFKVSFGEEIHDFDLHTATKFPTNWFVLSSQFMPLLYVNREDKLLYDLLFEARLNNLTPDTPLQSLPANCEYDTDNNLLLGNITLKITESTDPRNQPSCIVDLGRLAFYGILNQLKVLNIFLDQPYRFDKEKKNRDVKSGHIGIKKKDGKEIFEQYQFYEKIKFLIDEISDQPLIAQFIFATIIGSDGFSHTLRFSNADHFFNQLLSTWKFTKEAVYGLKELIKNITQHTVSGQGLITGRIYKKNIAKAFLESELEQLDVFADYFAGIDKRHSAIFRDILEISVADLGENGVTRKLLENSESFKQKLRANKDLENLIQEDIDLITSGKFSFKDLLHPPGIKPLHQQTKRAIAHWGFNIFTKLVKKNNGLLFAATEGLTLPRETAIISKQGILTYTNAVSFGTSFQIVFPIIPSQDFEPHLPDRIILPTETTQEDILGLEELFKVRTWNSRTDKEIKPIAKRRNLVTIALPEGTVNDRADEQILWEFLEPFIEELKSYGVRSSLLFNLDFDEVQLDSSQLLRLLSRWEDTYPQIPLMVSNIASQLLEELIILNKDFQEQQDAFPFWNKHAGVIFFSYALVRNNRFYFSDILWGETFDEYLVMNKLISSTSFNYSSFFIERDDKEGLVAQIEPYPSSPALYNRHVLLPLDVILQSKLGISFFEHNSIVLLENHIQPLTLTNES